MPFLYSFSRYFLNFPYYLLISVGSNCTTLALPLTFWGFAFGRVGGTKSCQHEANAGAGYKTSNLHVTPPDAKPVLAAGIYFVILFVARFNMQFNLFDSPIVVTRSRRNAVGSQGRCSRPSKYVFGKQLVIGKTVD